MKDVTKLLTGNAHDYEELISLLYKVGEITGVEVEDLVSKLDDLYDLGGK